MDTAKEMEELEPEFLEMKLPAFPAMVKAVFWWHNRLDNAHPAADLEEQEPNLLAMKHPAFPAMAPGGQTQERDALRFLNHRFLSLQPGELLLALMA